MSQIETKINVSINILPFGRNVIKIRSSEAAGEKKKYPQPTRNQKQLMPT